MLLGVDCSIAGGLKNAFAEAEKLGINTFQVFTKNQRQWKEKEVLEDEGSHFQSLYKPGGIVTAFSHATYLINLGSSEPGIYDNSILALAGELLRCHALGLKYTVLHPGACKGNSEKDTIERISAALKLVIKHTPIVKTKILLENTAGQGSCVGWKFEQLRDIINRTESDRIGICVDTCHAFAAGYDIRTQTGVEEMFSTIDNMVGLDHMHVLHLNDSKGDLGSRIDRHDHIGLGKIGIVPFQQIMKRFPDKPKILETNKDNDMDSKNLEILRSLVN